MSDSPLIGRVAVVTGGAGGIGSAICSELAERGASVIVGYNHSGTRAQALVDTLARGPRQDHAALPVAVTNTLTLDALADTVTARWQRCDILVNCAGTTSFVAHNDLDGLSDQIIDAILQTNVKGPFAAVRALRGLLDAGDGGLVVNISSVAAEIAMGSNVMYCASKAALDNMTRSLARALAPRIRVVSVSPGLVHTDFIANLDPAWLSEQIALTPLGRLAQPREIGLAVTALATDFTFVTGAVLPINGGRPLQ